MSGVLNLKRDPVWFSTLELNAADTAIILQGDGPESQVSVPGGLLVASSPLVRNILSAGHLPPVYSTPVISFPSVSAAILASVKEMLVLGKASMAMDRIRMYQVMEVFKMIGIDIETDVSENDYRRDNETVAENVNPDVFENLGSVIPDDCNQGGKMNSGNVNLEIIVKLERELKGLPDQVFSQAEDKSNTVSAVKHKGVVEEKKKFSEKKGQSCPKCGKMIASKTLSLHLKRVHEKETEQCPHCDKIFIKTEKFAHCDEKLSCNLRRHIRAVHDKETVQCSDCYKVLRCNSIYAHKARFCAYTAG